MITAAFGAELPLDFLKAQGYAVFNSASLAAFSPSFTQNPISSLGIAVVITGKGIDSSCQAMRQLIDKFHPLYVVNIGSAGNPSGDVPLGQWVMPDRIRMGTEAEMMPFDGLPFDGSPVFSNLKRGMLETVTAENTGFSRAAEFIDMEAYVQAAECRSAGISFHCLKYISDHCDSVSLGTYKSRLRGMREDLKRLLPQALSPEPDISVIIPSYNRASLLKRAVTSVLQQTLPAKEIIVVDDGSTDDTESVLHQFSEQVKIIKLPLNKGVSYARNVGIRESVAQWIAFLDSDDEWTKDKLETQWRFLARYPFYRIMQSDEMWIRKGKRVNPKQYHTKREGWIWKISLERCMISPSAVLLHRSLIEWSNGFDEMLPACEDYDLWLKITRRYPVGLSPRQTVIKYGGHDDQLSMTYPAMDRFRVMSLDRLFREETNPAFREALFNILKQKLEILINGASKRNNHEVLTQYHALLTEILRGFSMSKAP